MSESEGNWACLNCTSGPVGEEKVRQIDLLFRDLHFSDGSGIRELDCVIFCHYSLLKMNSTYFSFAMISIHKKLTPSFKLYSSF